MAEYINRETVQLKLHGKCEFCKKRDTCYNRWGSHRYCWELDDVLFPTADAVEVKRGEWELQYPEHNYLIYKCNKCDCYVGFSSNVKMYNYCPNCGAKMR